MFVTLNSCRRKLVCAKSMPSAGKICHCVPPSTVSKSIRKERSFLTNPLRWFSDPHLRGNFFFFLGVTTSQIHNLLGWTNGVQCPVLPSAQVSFPVSLAIGGPLTCVHRFHPSYLMMIAPLSPWIAFFGNQNGWKASGHEIWRRQEPFRCVCAKRVHVRCTFGCVLATW